MVEHIEEMHRVGGREGLVALDDHQVLVVFVRSLVTEIVAAGDDGRIVFHRVDDDDLIVHDGMADGQHLGLEVARDRRAGQVRGPHDRDVRHLPHLFREDERRPALLGHRLGNRVLLGLFVVWHRGRVADRALHDQFRICRSRSNRFGDDRVLAALGGIEDQEQHRFLGRPDAGEDIREIDRPHRNRLLVALRVVRRKPHRHAIDRCALAVERVGDVIVLAERHTLRLHGTTRREFARRWRKDVRLHAFPVIVENPRHLRVVTEEGIVGLAANAGGRPVGRAGHHRLRLAMAVAIDGEFVVADVVVVEEPVGHRHAGIMQRLAIRRVAEIPFLGLVVLAGIGKDDLDHILGADDGVAQHVIAEFVERQPYRATLTFRAFEQAGQNIRYITMQVSADLAGGVLQLLPDLVALANLDARIRQRMRHPLRRQNAIGEGDACLAEHRAEENRRADGALPQIAERTRRTGIGRLAVDLRRTHWHRFQSGLHVTDRPHAIGDHLAILPDVETVSPAAQRQIAPESLLHRPDAGVLRYPILVSLPLERHPGGQAALLARRRIKPDDFKAEAARDHAIDIPGDEGHLIVGCGSHFDDVGHGFPLRTNRHSWIGCGGSTLAASHGATVTPFTFCGAGCDAVSDATGR